MSWGPRQSWGTEKVAPSPPCPRTLSRRRRSSRSSRRQGGRHGRCSPQCSLCWCPHAEEPSRRAGGLLVPPPSVSPSVRLTRGTTPSRRSCSARPPPLRAGTPRSPPSPPAISSSTRSRHWRPPPPPDATGRPPMHECDSCSGVGPTYLDTASYVRGMYPTSIVGRHIIDSL
jgi:hypothetical protein